MSVSNHQPKPLPKFSEVIGISLAVVIEVKNRWADAEEGAKRGEVSGVNRAVADGVAEETEKSICRRANEYIVITGGAVIIAIEITTIDLIGKHRERVPPIGQRTKLHRPTGECQRHRISNGDNIQRDDCI